MSLEINQLKPQLKEVLEDHLSTEEEAILSAEKDLLAAAESEQSHQTLNLESKKEEMLETLEKRAQQADRIAEQRKQFDALHWDVRHDDVRLGTILNTTMGIFFVCIPAGQVDVQGHKVMCISKDAPIYAALAGKTKGDEFAWQGNLHRIEAIC